MKYRALVLVALFALPAPAVAQAPPEFLRTNPKFLHAFREVAAKPRASTVRVLCDGKETALGVVVGADGWVLTKAYDLKGKITCTLPDGTDVPARVVGVHPQHDLAMLRVAARDLPAVTFADSKGVKAGSWVASVGPAADPVAVGVVSVPTRDVKTKGVPAVVDPAKAAYLGIALDPTEDGVRVAQVMPNSAAAKAGLKADDVLLSVDGAAINDPDEFVQQMARHKPGDTVTLRYRRGEEEREAAATLQSRPASSARAELQNRMGSELSSRRAGYPTILQHDSVVRPTDCGGPLVDLQGRVLGINISRAGRVESWAVPSEVIRPLLADLKSGKLAPPAEAVSRAGEVAVDALLTAMQKRLRLMPDVARAKWNAGRLGRDRGRETELLDRLAAQGKAKGLDGAEVRRLFAAQIDAAWLAQEGLFAGWTAKGAGTFADVPDLADATRPRVDAASDALLTAYAAARPHLPAARSWLPDRARALLTGDGVTDAVRERALEPLLGQ